jgi:hypothetical protein
LYVDRPIDRKQSTWLNVGLTRVPELTAVEKIGRPSPSVAPVGIRFTSTSTGRLRPSALTYPIATEKSVPIARSSCTFVRIAYCVENAGSTVTMLCLGRTKPGGRSASVPGNAGAPALVGLSVTASVRGSPLRWIASS